MYDGNDIALMIVKSGSSWWVKGRYLTGGLDANLLGRFRTEDGSITHNLVLVNDRLGSTLEALRSDGTLEPSTQYFDRDPFGWSVGASGTGSTLNTETGFTGASTPNSTGGFVYLRNRWFDPKTGRFLTQDPIGLAGGVNLYAYAGNNPVTFSDPFGLLPGPCDGPFLGTTATKFSACMRQRTGNGALQHIVNIWASVMLFVLPGATEGSYAIDGLAIGRASRLGSVVNSAVQAGRSVSGAGRQIFEAGRAVGQAGLDQPGATSAVRQAVVKLGYDIGETVRINGVNYVTSGRATNNVVDAVAVHADGTTTKALLRIGERGAFELLKDLGAIPAAH